LTFYAITGIFHRDRRATPKHELDLIKARLRWAQRHARGEV